MAEELELEARFRTADRLLVAPPTSGWLIPAKVGLGSWRNEPTVICEFDHPNWTGAVTLSKSSDRWVRESDRANQRALEMFLELEDASDTRIREFVQEHGPIRVMPNGGVIADHVGLPSSKPFFEPLRWYRDYAKLAGATIRASIAVVHGEPIASDDVIVLRDFMVRTFRKDDSRERRPGEDDFMRFVLTLEAIKKHAHEATSDEARAAIVMTVTNWWLEVKAVRQRLDWFGADRRVRWTGGLWGAIGLQLMRRVQRELGRVVCARCGKPLGPTEDGRRHRPGARCPRKECVRKYERERKAAARAAASKN
jgi:hypothetical protein